VDGQILIILLLALAGGAVLGWLLGSRPAADLRARLAESESAARDLDGRFRAAIKDWGDASIKLATLRRMPPISKSKNVCC
jgi:DNA recombination protein RmuC